MDALTSIKKKNSYLILLQISVLMIFIVETRSVVFHFFFSQFSCLVTKDFLYVFDASICCWVMAK